MIKRLLKFLFPRRPAFTDRLPVLWCDTWSQMDRDNLSRFLASTSGRKMVQRMRSFEAVNAIAGAKDMLHTSHSAGRSMGYGEAVDHLISLSSACDVKQATDIGAPGVAPADETDAQREAREAAELLWRHSP